MFRILICVLALFSVLNISSSQEKNEIIDNIVKNFPDSIVFEYKMNSTFTDNSKGSISSQLKCVEMIVPSESEIGYYYHYYSNTDEDVCIYNGAEHFSYYPKYYGIGKVRLLIKVKHPENFKDRPIKIDDMEGFVPSVQKSSSHEYLAISSIMKSLLNSSFIKITDTIFNNIDCYKINDVPNILIVDKDNFLPVYAENSNIYQSHTATYSDFKFNQSKFEDLFTKKYFPESFDFSDSHQTINRTLQAGTLAPDFEMKTIKDKTIKLSDFIGQNVFLFVTEIGCPPCMLALPDINGFSKEFKDLKFFGVYTKDSKDELIKLAEKKKLEFDIGYKVEEVIEKYGIGGYPTFFIIDKKGKIVFSNTGYSKEYKEILKKEIDIVVE